MLKLIADVARKMPFSFFPGLYDLLKEYQINTVLDIGCGNGDLMSILNKDNSLTVDGVDLFDPYLKKAKDTGAYRKLYKKNFLTFLPEEKYDLIFASHVIEHIKKKEGITLLRNMKKMTRKLGIVMTPYGYCDQHEYDGNKLQEHQSGWSPKDFQKEGYACKIKGLSYWLVRDDGDMWHETIRFKILKKLLSPFISLPEPYLICTFKK